MPVKEINLDNKVKSILDAFIRSLENIYRDNLVSVILYGSAASGEFVNKRSNLNIIVVLNRDDLSEIKKASGLINKPKFSIIKPLFFTQEYISTSCDVFPIEFLDIKENYIVVSGKDVLKDINIDTRNLRFQCEQELKARLINLRHAYLRVRNPGALRDLLLNSFTSILHILRSVLKIKGKVAPYLKQEVIKEVSKEFQINASIWESILAAKNNRIKLSNKEVEELFINFMSDLNKVCNAVDRL